MNTCTDAYYVLYVSHEVTKLMQMTTHTEIISSEARTHFYLCIYRTPSTITAQIRLLCKHVLYAVLVGVVNDCDDCQLNV